VADAKAAVGKAVVERAATALPDSSPGVVEKGNTAVDEDRVDWLRTEDDIAGGIERVLAADRRVLAVPLPVLVPLAVPCCDCAGRLRDFVGSGRGVDVFGDLKANDENPGNSNPSLQQSHRRTRYLMTPSAPYPHRLSRPRPEATAPLGSLTTDAANDEFGCH
jgi:hypothetical protein